jgi:RNA polymerase sigma factor (sigma-70 family)
MDGIEPCDGGAGQEPVDLRCLGPATEPRPDKVANRDPLTAEQRDLAARYLPLARTLARPYKRRWGFARDEFESAACLAVVEAAQSFDPSKGVPFATYARIRILGELRDVLREQVVSGYNDDAEDAPTVVSLFRNAEEKGRVLGPTPAPPVGHDLEAEEEFDVLMRGLPTKNERACRELYVHDQSKNQAAETLGVTRSGLESLRRDAIAMVNEVYSWNQRIEALLELCQASQVCCPGECEEPAFTTVSYIHIFS